MEVRASGRGGIRASPRGGEVGKRQDDEGGKLAIIETIASRVGQDSPVTITLWLRGDASPSIQDRIDWVLEQLHHVTHRTPSTEFNVRVWGSYLRHPNELDEDDPEVQQRWSAYEAFEAWSAENGCSLEPAFRRRIEQSYFAKESCEMIRLPHITLAVRSEGNIIGVAPSVVDGTPITVPEVLTRLQAVPESGE